MEAQKNDVTCQDFTAKRSNRGHECGSSDVTISTSLSGTHASYPMVAVISHRLPCLAIYLDKIHIACLPRREKSNSHHRDRSDGAEPP